jgi:hypothetical protein
MLAASFSDPAIPTKLEKAQYWKDQLPAVISVRVMDVITSKRDGQWTKVSTEAPP